MLPSYSTRFGRSFRLDMTKGTRYLDGIVRLTRWTTFSGSDWYAPFSMLVERASIEGQQSASLIISWSSSR